MSKLQSLNMSRQVILHCLNYSLIILMAFGLLPGVLCTKSEHSESRLLSKNSYGYEKEENSSWINYGKSTRQERLLPFFALVSFPATICKGDDGRLGVCLSTKRCNAAGGSDSGSCASGYGTCCFISTTCGNNPATVTSNGTHLINPSSFVNLCRYVIPKQNGVCQIRLDFTSFTIGEGDTAALLGDCDGDTLTISGATNAVVGPICGDMTGQQMYLDYGGNDKINIDVYRLMDMGSNWDIRVTMIKCDSTERAPDGCLQYYTAPRGMVKSFNYINQHQLNNEDYSVCIKPVVGMTKITWRTCGGNNDFVVTGENTASNGISVTGSACVTDWVMIYGVDKYCGTGFPTQPVTSGTQPFMIQVHFDDAENIFPPPSDGCGTMDNPCLGPSGDNANTGFCLMYTQTP